MGCNTCGRGGYSPGIVHRISQAQRNANNISCAHTLEDIKEYRNKIVCILKSSEPAINKYTLTTYVSILSVAIASGNICSGKILSIKEAIENISCDE